MDQANCTCAAGLISAGYIAQGAQALSKRERLVKTLLSQRRLPLIGWDEATIEMFIQDVALMDSNNFLGNVGVGEREARVACPLVARRHYRLAHGIGRSGDISAEQPKAAGSSLLARLTGLLAADALRLAGLADLGPVTVLPFATGMAMTMTLLAMRTKRPASAHYVVWPRIDQKTCLKAINTAGLEVVIVPMARSGDQLVTDCTAIEQTIEQLGSDSVVCVASTTSCFAPRAADEVVNIARLCQRLGVPHMINNAYGIQSAHLCRSITKAWRVGRVDAVVQSTDKNFMVPVGGAIVAAPACNPSAVHAVNGLYPGRACMAPLLDLLMTLLHWGAEGWARVLQEREELYTYARSALDAFAVQHGERLLNTPDNPISLAITLSGIEIDQHDEDATMVGSMLFSRFASGARVVARLKSASVAGYQFQGYGAHCDAYPHNYLTMAAALGTKKDDIMAFLNKLGAVLTILKRKASQQEAEHGTA